MVERIAEGNGWAGRSATFGALRTALVLLLCGTSWGRGDEAVRQEAPFPTVLGGQTAKCEGEPVGLEVLRGDFHMHTPHSDGRLSPADRVMEAWRYGYDAIAITDHGNFRAYEEAVSTAESVGIILIRGMETGIGGAEHFVALGFGGDYQPQDSHRWAEADGGAKVFYREQLRRLARADGFVVYAHPHVGLREPVLWGIEQGLLGGIEVKNDVVGTGWNTVESHGTHWYPFALDWAVEHDLTIFANSDVHATRGESEQAVTLLLVKDRSRDGVMDALRTGRTVACFNGMLCGHAWVVEPLIASLSQVDVVDLAEDRVLLRVQNRGPIPLTARIDDTPVEPVTVGPYQKVLVDLPSRPEALAVTWTNVYTRSTSNVTTTHPPTTVGK